MSHFVKNKNTTIFPLMTLLMITADALICVPAARDSQGARGSWPAWNHSFITTSAFLNPWDPANPCWLDGG